MLMYAFFFLLLKAKREIYIVPCDVKVRNNVQPKKVYRQVKQGESRRMRFVWVGEAVAGQGRAGQGMGKNIKCTGKSKGE